MHLAGFVEEMRFVAMKLHTKDQAPKEGGQKAAEQPFQKVTWLLVMILSCGAVASMSTGRLLVHASRAAIFHVVTCPAYIAVGANARRLPAIPGGVKDSVPDPGGHRGRGQPPRM